MMLNSPLPEPEILKTILRPLLEDFDYWFAKSLQVLENETLSFLEPSQQQDLITRIHQAQQEVAAARALLLATNGQAIIEMPLVHSWHCLVAECWKISVQRRANLA